MMIWNSCRKIKTETTLFSLYRPSSIKTLSMLTALFCVMPLAFAAQGDNLSKIHQQIKQQEQKIAGQKAEQQKLQSTLKYQENHIKNLIFKLLQT